MVSGDKLFKRDICVGFLLYLKTCFLVTFHPNVLKLGKAANSYLLFHVIDHFFGNY